MILPEPLKYGIRIIIICQRNVLVAVGTKGGKGSSGTVHCSQCGAMVPRDKAKKITGRVTLVEPTLAKELRAQGAYISPATDVKFYCVSCAVHRGIVKVKSELERRVNTRLR